MNERERKMIGLLPRPCLNESSLEMHKQYEIIDKSLLPEDKNAFVKSAYNEGIKGLSKKELKMLSLLDE